jgi:EpsI family protein
MIPRLRNLLLLGLMLAAAGLAVVLRPTHKIADHAPKVELARMIPHQFADWREETQPSAMIVDPQQQAMVDKLYNQTLSRTYVNESGYRIMLSIAYGSDQSDAMQVHKPEVCYPSQGFVLQGRQAGSLALGKDSIPVTRILTTLGQRHEPITYWTTIADQVVRGGLNKKLIEMRYGLSGKIPDGMLIRVSSIDPESAQAYEIQSRFAAALLEAVAPEHRQRFSGRVVAN